MADKKNKQTANETRQVRGQGWETMVSLRWLLMKIVLKAGL